MYNGASLEVNRDVAATLIPSGDKVTLKKGSLVMVTQALGTAYTLYVNGNLVRIAGNEGDAIGLPLLDVPDINATDEPVEDKIITQLKTCYDPEIPVNVVDLGLIYHHELMPIGKNSYAVQVTMTLTAAGCGMGPVLVAEIEEKLRQIKEIEQVKIDLVFDPPWDRDRMSEEARLQMGLL